MGWTKKFDVIYADPPWLYNGKMISGSKVTHHYEPLSTADLKALPVGDAANKNSVLFMWTSSPHLCDAIEVMKSWGFKYATIAFVWDKVNPVAGSYTMSQCEICIVGKRGKIPSPRGSRAIRQFLTWKRTEHSAKPDEVRKRIEDMFPEAKRLELFHRGHPSSGWTCLGNESLGDWKDIRESLPQLISKLGHGDVIPDKE
jgi:N6-adenosine-specific RNA methylase IME4